MRKISKLQSIKFCCIAMTIAFFAKPIFADSSLSDDLDSKLMEKEKNPATLFLNQAPNKAKKSHKKSPKRNLSGSSQIIGNLKPINDINELDQRINKINSNLKILTAKIKQKQQEIMNEMNVDNLIAFNVTLAKSDIANIQQIEIKVDGMSIFKSDKFSGLWMPKDSLPVYYGSLNPGKHRIDVMARIVMLNPSDVPLNESLYRMINKSFSISIPIGSFRRKWVFTIFPPNNLNEPVKAEMFEGDLNS